MKCSEIKKVLGDRLQVIGDEDFEIRHLLTDSRQLGKEPEATLFFAIKTAKNDGAKYIPELQEKGVRAFVKDDALDALQDIAAYVRDQFDGTVIGITGSNGKTVVKEWLYQLLKEDYNIIRSPKSYNSQIGVPLSVWQLQNAECRKQNTDRKCIAIFEAGISQPGEMEKLERIIRPTIGVITYIGHEHDENFESLEQKRAEKMKLFVHSQKVIEDSTHQNVRTCAAVMRALGYDEETIVERILQQTHETVMKVNLSALVDNVRYFRSLLKPETKLTCMVKAFAYGAGSVEVSKALQASGLVDYLAVAVADEGVELRRAGITLPIIIMDPEVAAMDLILENNLEPNVYSHQSLKTVMAAAEAKGLENYPIHIKIDSGMHREGVRPEYAQDILKYAKYRGVSIDAVYTHYACADSIDKQNKEFDAVEFDDLRHTSATSAYISGLDSYDCLRVGLAVYGYPSGHGLIPALKVTSNVLNVLDVKRGESIGYDLAYAPERDTKIAIVGGGYADGIKRAYSGAEVLINGERVSIVGRVCMDSFSVDVKDVDVKVGDEVVIIGDGLTAETFAKKANTIPYEVLCGFDTKRARRYYV